LIAALAYAAGGVLKARAQALEEAGTRGDIPLIGELLPAFYADLKAAAEAEKEPVSAAGPGAGKESPPDRLFPEKLAALKDALEMKDSESEDRIMAELFTLPLTGDDRELFISLYDLLLTEETDKAKGLIESWKG
jgi:hypothetical protein